MKTPEEIMADVFREGWFCADCPMCQHSTEREPYGNGHARSLTRECREDDPEKCPGVIAEMER